jgi:heterodisulfide reductase subunit A
VTGEPGVLVIGAGVTGMKASLLLADAGRKVWLVESTSVTGGNLIRCEDVFTGMECATCMVSPMQQEVLRHGMIEVMTLARVTSVEGSRDAGYRVAVRQDPSFVDPVACIGCGECWGACPVELPNAFEEGMGSRKAISVPCAGALPNVPWIDRSACRRWTGEDPDCTLCSEACVFEAIDYASEGRDLQLDVTDIIVATGSAMPDPATLSPLGWGTVPGVFTAMEFERLYASNGPTSGEIVLRDGRVPSSAAVLVHADPSGSASFSHLNSLCALKYVHYLHHKVPGISVTLVTDNLCTPGRDSQRFHERVADEGTSVVRSPSADRISVEADGEAVAVSFESGGESVGLLTDMLILVPPVIPSSGTAEMRGVLGSAGDGGVTFAGTAAGMADVAQCTVSASAAVAAVLGGGRGSDL